MKQLFSLCGVVAVSVALVSSTAARIATAGAAGSVATLELEDYLAMPLTGLVDGKGSNELLLSRVNALREEAGGAKRLFITDLNGPLYILDKDTKKPTVYLDFNGTERKTGLF